MNGVGRQMQRSGSTGGYHHQRQYSENFLDTNFNNKWLQSAALHSSNSTDFGLYGNGGVDSSRLSRNVQRIGNGGGSEVPFTPPVLSRSSSLRKYGSGEQVSPSELSPGLLDLHSFDTELLPEVVHNSQNVGHILNQPFSRQGFDNREPYNVTEKLGNSARGLPEKNLPKSFSSDKERASNVAKIKVVVRKRPLNRKEIARKEDDVISISPNTNSLVVHETKLKVDLTEYVEKHEFMFDAVMNEDISNDEIYSQTVEPIVPIIFQRTKATCFAYGQTGSGKTYTMQPLPLKASQDILKLMHHNYRHQGFQLHVSFFEIYGGKLFDLLNDRNKLCMREDGKQQVCIVGLQEYWVSDVETVKELIEKGNATRSTGTTGANEESSRSHAILQLAIKKFVDGNESKPARVVGKLSFIDLAGSERGADTTDNDKQTRMEGAEINKSLLALKECIRALDNDQGHIPFRGSKLTEVLRDSFVGDSRTVMISCISPNSGSCEHTLNTLRYADRVKSLSKGSSSRKDPSSLSLNLRSSIALPLSSVSPTLPISESNKTDTRPESNRFGWSKQIDREPSQSFNLERVPSGRIQSSSLSTVFTDDYKGHTNVREETMEDDFVYPEETFKPRALEGNMQKHSTQIKPNDMTRFEGINSHSDDDLNVLLKEEEDLLIAHRKQVEETMEIVKEEMKLLVEVDEPGNQLDEYISKLNAILSKKAVSILQLQTRLENFQKSLKEYNVLASSSGQ